MAHEHDPRDEHGPLPDSTQENENTRVTIEGRIGAEPRIKTVEEKGLLVASFSVAEHPDEQDSDATKWHEVVVFGDRAAKLQERFQTGELHVGQLVSVAGYKHLRERPVIDKETGAQTGTRMVEQIYAAAIKPVAPKGPNANGGRR